MPPNLASGHVRRVARGLLLLFAIVWLRPLAPAAQRPEPMTAARIRALTEAAQAAARGDESELVLALDASVRDRWGDFESFPISLVKRDDLSIILASPYMTYRRTLAAYLRIGRPAADVPWVASIVVTVSPSQIGAPDIERIVVTRGGMAVPPIENRLRPMTFSNGRGEEAAIHGGEVHFPLTAFAPGAAVTVAAQTKDTAAFETHLTEAQLETLK